MTILLASLTFLLGLGAGAVAMYIWQQRSHASMSGNLKDAFNSLAAQALAQNNQQFLQLAHEKLSQSQQANAQELTGKQSLIDQRLATIQTEVTAKLEKVTTLVTEIDKNRHASFATLQQQLGHTGEQLKSLQTTTADLRSALTNSRTRGQWGERMAEDVLRLAGMRENIQYRKQSTLVATSGAGGRPDYTFLLPGQRVIHMDVKFPLDNYLLWLNAETDDQRNAAATQFVRDARNRLKETNVRDYRTVLTQQGEQALDYLLVFIPNEQVYAFLLENAPNLLDEALSQKIILTSPTTLLAVLAVVNQAAQHFRLQQQAAGIHDILTSIKREWEKYGTEMDKIGKKLREAQATFDDVTGTRTRMLDRQFTKLDSLPSEADTQPSLLAQAHPLPPLQ
ncbi:MAG: DNA recombination protein RmuC [Alphaproteobacteria bacterium]|nr:MAG: DNA recombination protein RmuC [Alphaproteobacteria bacterium]